MGFLNWIVTTNKGEREVKIPIMWDQVTLKQDVNLVNNWDGTDLVKLFSILSGLSVKAINETFDPALYEQLEISTRFVFEGTAPYKDKDYPMPKTVTVNGKVLNVPANIKGLTIGQSVLVQQAIDSTETYDEIMPLALACFFQPQYDETNEFSDRRAMELLPHFESMAASEGWPIAVFLLRPWLNHGKGIMSKLNRMIIRLFSRSLQREPR